MVACPLLIHFNGYWSQENTFLNYDTDGIVMTEQNCFEVFYNVLSDQLKINKDTTELKIHFQLNEDLAPMSITNDLNLLFYMQMRNSVDNVMKYPLFITMEKRPNLESTMNQQAIRESEKEAELPGQEVEESSLDMIDYVHQLNHQLLEELDNHERVEDDEVEEKDESIITDKRFKNFEEGQIFINKSTLQNALSFYPIKERFQFRTERSSQRHYFLKCIDNKCSWILQASRCGKASAFKIKKFENSHTCDLEIRFSGKRQATRKLIGELIKMKYVQPKTVYTPADIIDDMRNGYGITINYQKAWNSKEKALELIRGKSVDLYALLPSYLHMLQQTNPGSAIELKREPNNAFLYVFIAFNASIKGWEYCRPTVVVDGTFLKATHRGTLISACTQDASGAIFPLAFCVVDSENDLAWTWFFTKFKETYRCRKEMSIESDRHESIAKAVKKIYPEINHYVCTYHLRCNLKTRFKKNSKKVGMYFIRAAKSYTITEFEMDMAQLDSVDKDIRTYLSNIGYERWARCYQFKNRSYNLTSNIAESLNAVNKAARELPITALLEQLRDLTQKWSVKNRLTAQSTRTTLVRKHENVLKNNYIEAEKYEVKESNENVYQVSVGRDAFVVNLEARSCTCNCFQINEIPCAHALAVTGYKHIEAYEFCSEYFTKEAMLATYESSIFPIPKQDTWDIPADVEGIIVFPPLGRKKAGR